METSFSSGWSLFKDTLPFFHSQPSANASSYLGGGRILVMLLCLVSTNLSTSLLSAQTSCTKYQNVMLSAQNDGSITDCFRKKIVYFFRDVAQSGQTHFTGSNIQITLQIQGDAVFEADNNLTKVHYPGYTVALLDPSTLFVTLSCSPNPWLFYYGDFLNPFMDVYILPNPGAAFQIQTTVSVFSDQVSGCTQACDIPATDPSYSPNTSVCPSSGLTVQLLPFYVASTMSYNHYIEYNPHTEVPVYLNIANNGNTAVNLSEMMLSLSLHDKYCTLPDVAPGDLDEYFVEGTNPENDPVFDYHEGDNHYFYLNTFSDPVLSPGEVLEVLAFTIRPPGDLGNMLGQADIQVGFVQVLQNSSECCTLNTTEAYGSINFPGISPCNTEPCIPVAEAPITFRTQAADPSVFDDCETGFFIVADVKTIGGSPSSVQIEALSLEFTTLTTGNLSLEQINVPAGVQTNFSCNPGTCPPGTSGSCSTCSATITYSSSTPLTLADGDSWLVILRGTDGTSIEQIDFKASSVRYYQQTKNCAPEVNEESSFLPVRNECLHCLDVNVEVKEDNGIPLNNCEMAFGVYLNAPSNSTWDQIRVEITFQNPDNLPFEITNIFCPNQNSCTPVLPPGAHSAGSCVYVLGNTVYYQYCPVGISFGGNVKLFNVEFTGNGCLSNIMFSMNTQVDLAGQNPCIPEDVSTMNPVEFCNGCFSGVFGASGNIHTEKGYPVDVPILPIGSTPFNEDSGIEIQSTSTPCNQLLSTDGCTGNYSLSISCEGSNQFTIKPIKDTKPMNGVTTFDLVLISKHILGTQLLDSPYKIIAADINKTNSVTTSDLVEIRKLILLIIEEFPNNNSWRFVDAAYIFPNPTNPFVEQFPEMINVSLTPESETSGLDFIAIKVGDVNNSADPCLNLLSGGNETVERGSGLPVYFLIGNRAKRGEILEIPIYLESPQSLSAWQMGLQFDRQKLQMEQILPGDLDDLSLANFGMTEVETGKLRALWYAGNGQPVPFEGGRKLFTLRFKALRDVEDLSRFMTFDNESLQALAFENDGAEHGLEIKFGMPPNPVSLISEPEGALSVSVLPNPFRRELRFTVSVQEAGPLQIALFDAAGRQVSLWKGQAQAGENVVTLQPTETWGNGIFTWQVSAYGELKSGTVNKQ
jgi:hypothetical protein